MTLRSYGQAWDSFEAVLLPVKKTEEVRAAVKAGVVEMMSTGKLQPSSINVYLRAMNAFIRWGSLEEHFKPPIKSVPLLKTPTKVIPTLNETQVQNIVQFKPKWRKERRVHAMSMLVLDTGLRLNECLQLEVRDIDLENFLVTVQKGKGDKQRKVPISGVGRKVLYRYINQGGELLPIQDVLLVERPWPLAALNRQPFDLDVALEKFNVVTPGEERVQPSDVNVHA